MRKYKIKKFIYRLAKRQIIGLMKLTTFCQNSSLVEQRQEQLRVQCLKYWQIPDKARIPHLPHIAIEDLVPVNFLSPSRYTSK